MKDVIIFVADKMCQRTVDRIILAGFHFDRDCGKTVVVINQIIDLASASVVVIVQLISVCDQLAGDRAFINGAEIDASLGFVFRS